MILTSRWDIENWLKPAYSCVVSAHRYINCRPHESKCRIDRRALSIARCSFVVVVLIGSYRTIRKINLPNSVKVIIDLKSRSFFRCGKSKCSCWWHFVDRTIRVVSRGRILLLSQKVIYNIFGISIIFSLSDFHLRNSRNGKMNEGSSIFSV